MKSQEEIDEVYKRLYLSLDDSPHYHTWIRGYTQCQEDMELSDWDVTLTDGLEEEEWDTKQAQSPKDKAEDLFVTYYQRFPDSIYSNEGAKAEAKWFASNTVDEIINTLNSDIRDLDVRGNILLDLIEYWREVKQEIDKL